MQVAINNHLLELTNLDKPYWPEEGLVKRDLVQYYRDIAPYLLPYLKERPIVLVRYPDGVAGEYFYQKECPDYAPDWLQTVPVVHSDKTVNYILVGDLESLLWVANQAAIEIHPWLSRRQNDNHPDQAVVDLDPSAGSTFTDVLQVAMLVREGLREFGLEGYPKTSGASGLHIYVPIISDYTFSEVSHAIGWLAGLIVKVFPQKATVERLVRNRTGRVYLDYLQNGRGKTIASVYSLRPQPGAPVSTPLTWEEIRQGDFGPGDFNMRNIHDRLKQIGDIFQPVLDRPQRLDRLIKAARH